MWAFGGVADVPFEGRHQRVARIPRSRTILHVDMDAFYVSVELLRRPELRGRPVVVGGTGSRGVVAAASYEARRFGVHSAMSSAQARQRCPDAVFLPGDHQHYAEVSDVLHDVFAEFSPVIEPIALDEAFLDVTASRRGSGSGVELAHRLRHRVLQRTGLTCSVGVAGNKLLAKLASEAAKPQATASGVQPGAGVVQVPAGEELAFLHPLPVRALWGVGPRTAERLERRLVRTVGDLAALRREDLVALLGVAAGRHLWELAQGVDDRPVEPDRQPKSIGNEETFAHDLSTVDEVRAQVVRLADSVAARLRRAGIGARTVSLKLKRSDFTTVTRSVTSPEPLDTAPGIMEALDQVLTAVDMTQGVRLVGISGSNLTSMSLQLRLDLPGDLSEPTSQSSLARHEAAQALDRVRERFGVDAIGPASALDRSRAPRSSPWGPQAETT
jgi:DNA polymerase IV